MNVAVAFDVVRKAGWDVKLERLQHSEYVGSFQSVTFRSPRCEHCGNQHIIAGALAPGVSSNSLQVFAAYMRNRFHDHLEAGCRH